MFKTIKDKYRFFSENKSITLTIVFILIALIMVIAFSYLGTMRMLSQSIETLAYTELDKANRDVENLISDCRLYVRLICNSYENNKTYEDTINEISLHSKHMAELFPDSYIGTYAECGDTIYKSPDLKNISSKRWYKECRNSPNTEKVYIEEGRNGLRDSFITIARYDTETDSIGAVCLRADSVISAMPPNPSFNMMFDTVIFGSSGSLVHLDNYSGRENAAEFLQSAEGAALLASLHGRAKGSTVFTMNGAEQTAYYCRFLDNWYIMYYASTLSLFKDFYLFSIIQYIVIMLIFLLFIMFFVQNHTNSLRLERALKTRSAFLTNMSHEIRTPLNAIIGMSEILLRRDVHGAARNDVVSIHNAGTGLLAIINDILDYSKMESGGFKIINDEYDLPGLVTEVVSLMSFRLKEKDVRLMVNINPAVPRRLIGDEVRIKQILVNLLGNAVKFTERGYIILSVDWDFINNGETNLTLKVADTGIGIAEEEAKLLFDEFIQADAGAKSKHGGTGLGLYISKNLAQQMGGSISLESALGKGSTFTVTVKNKVDNYVPFAAVSDENIMLGIYERDITLAGLLGVSLDMLHIKYRIISDTSDPDNFIDLTHIFFRKKWKNEVGRMLGGLDINPVCILLTEAGDDSETDTSIKKLMINLFGLQIADCLNGEIKYFDRYSGFDTGEIVTIPDARALLVDDNITNMAVAKGILAEYNILIDTAVDGAQALEMVQNREYDIVFMDNMMPVMDGIEATHRIRQLEGDYYKNLPIIALTALAGRGDRERFQTLGFDEFLSKPIDLNKMDIILHKFLQNKIKDIYDISTAKEENISVEQDLVIDTEAGIRQFGHNKDSYADILTIYVQDMEKRYSQLVDGKDDIDKKTINFHAIKGSSANVGAYRLNEMAAEMEKLGKAKDTQAIDNMTEQFLQLLDLTINSAKDYLQTYKGIQNESKGYKYAVESRYIDDIITACENMDMIKIEDIYETITHYVYPENTMKLLEKIKLASFEYDYDKIKEEVQKLR